MNDALSSTLGGLKMQRTRRLTFSSILLLAIIATSIVNIQTTTSSAAQITPKTGNLSTIEINGLRLDTVPIYAPVGIKYPDNKNRTCTFTSAELSRPDGSDFLSTDEFSIQTSLENLDFTINNAPQPNGEVGIRKVPDGAEGISKLGIRVQLCASEIVDIKPAFLRLKVKNLVDQKEIIGTIPVLYPVKNSTIAAETAKVNCGIGPYSVVPRFSNNVVFSSYWSTNSLVNRKLTTTHLIEGIVFRSGLIAANEKLSFYLSNNNFRNYFLGSATTDNVGAFSFQFKLNFLDSSIKPSGHPRIMVHLQERGIPLGVINDPQPAELLTYQFNWATSDRLTPPIDNWIPRQTSACNAAVGIGVGTEDEDHPLAWMTLKALWDRFKNKQYKLNQSDKKIIQVNNSNSVGSKTSTSNSSGASGSSNGSSLSVKKCWVNGYTTKSGKRVSGYFRRC